VQRVSWALTVGQLFLIPLEVGYISMKNHMMFLGGAPSAKLLLYQANTCHKIDFCEVTKLAASSQGQR
jgi:hypothetical protein